MTQLKATANIVFDITAIAQAISVQAWDALPAQKIGLYEKGINEPVMVADKNYHKRTATGKMLTSETTGFLYPEILIEPVKWNDPITDDVYDEDGVVVARKAMRFHYSFTPDTASAARALVVSVLEHNIERHSNIYPVQHKDMSAVILSHLRPELQDLYQRALVDNKWAPSWEEEKALEALDTLFDTIREEILDIETALIQFMDKDHWFVFILKEVNGDVLVTRTHDYRVIAWEKEHGEEFRKTCGKRIR